MTTELAIEGMTCGRCVRHVHQALGALDGVQLVEVHASRTGARVLHDATVSADLLLQAVRDAGYDASMQAR